MSERIESRSLQDVLIERGFISPQTSAQLTEDAHRHAMSVRDVLASNGLVKERDLAICYAESISLPYIDLETYSVDTDILKLVNENITRTFNFIPLFKIGQTLTIAMTDPANIVATDAIRGETGFDLDFMVSTNSGIRAALDQNFGKSGSMREVIDNLNPDEVVSHVPFELNDAKSNDSLASVDQAPIIRLVNTIVLQAVQEGASDIHISPEDAQLRIRFRTDGLLHDVPAPPKNFHGGIVARIKVLSDMDISESRKPQDGRFRLKVEGRLVDIRVSIIPTVRGENVVMRVLDSRGTLRDLEQLGLGERENKTFADLIKRPHGILLVTGPTGSGKTVSLYAALRTINSVDRHIITVEDPVEFWLDSIRQIQVNPRAGLTFSSGLRAILRHDPDVVMVGEIRDVETAQTAVHASLTGHLVFSTLHTNDAPGAIVRLIDMGIEPFLVSSSLSGVIAQRLVRTVCSRCREEYQPPIGLVTDAGLRDRLGEIKFYRGTGCSMCNQTGYRGRTGVFELLAVTDDMREMILKKPSPRQLLEAARQGGLRTLKEDGIEKAVQGITTLEEVARVTTLE